MNAKIISPTADAIQQRVIMAIDYLITSKKMASLSAWCHDHGLNRVKYSNLRSSYKSGRSATGYKVIDIDILNYLVSDFGVSPSWLITGSGNEFI